MQCTPSGVAEGVGGDDNDDARDSGDDDANSADGSRSKAGWQARKTFVLNGTTQTFESPVSLVLAAARQLGMSISRDGHLLWIADEALLDEYDEEQAEALPSVPLLPLSEDVLAYYADVYEQRSKVLRVKTDGAGSMAPNTSECPDGAAVTTAASATAAAPTAAAPTAAAVAASAASKARKANMTKQESRREHKRERRRKRLALREARLSNISERYTEEMEPLLDEDGAPLPADDFFPAEGQGPQVSAHSPRAAVWPAPLGAPARLSPPKGALPRIDSVPLSLDQMGQADSLEHIEETQAAGEPARPHAHPLHGSCEADSAAHGLAALEVAGRLPGEKTAAAAAATPAAAVAATAAAALQSMELSTGTPVERNVGARALPPAALATVAMVGGDAPTYNIGARVEVDFDDEVRTR